MPFLGSNSLSSFPPTAFIGGSPEFLFAAYDADGNLMLGTRTSVDETFPPKLFEQVHRARAGWRRT